MALKINTNDFETGTVRFMDFEGGFFGIITDEGKHYDPINLESDYQIDGLRIHFKAKIRDDLGSFHMWGTIIEITWIEKI
ncbi:MAG: hypothetical protein ACFFC7_08530 [Candidatus Hermodarchaeota archaeon]